MMTTTTGTTIAALEVHPVADLFPMLPDDELKDLAADITERGLLQPIVLDKEGRILDGRNRHAACQLAGIEPIFTTYDGDDPAGYALAVNIARRHLSKGQQAMVIAKANDKLFVKNNRGWQLRVAATGNVSQPLLSKASVVLEFAPDLVDGVVTGSVHLNNAYDEARKRKCAAENTAEQMAELHTEAPDLADLVAEERMSLSEAMAALRAREAKRESERHAAISNLRSVLTYLTSTELKPGELAAEYADAVDEFAQQDLNYAAQTMAAIAKSRKNRK